MDRSELIPTSKITHQQTGYIDVAIQRLTMTDILRLSGPGDSPKNVLSQLQKGTLAYLTPNPEQPLYLYKNQLIPNPKYCQQPPAPDLLAGLQHLWPSAMPPRTGPACPRIRPAAVFDPSTYRPPIPTEDRPPPYWEARCVDELWFNQGQLPVRLKPSAADEQETHLDYCSRTPQVRQDSAAQLQVRLFPAQGGDCTHDPQTHIAYSERFVTFDGNSVKLSLASSQPSDSLVRQLNFTLKSRAHTALILFPALGTPALVHPEQKTVHLVLAVDTAFHRVIQIEQVDGEAGPMSLRRLYAQLRLHRWNNSDKHAPGIQHLYPNLNTALEQIRLHPLGPLTAVDPPGLVVSAADGRQLGILHADAVNHYREAGYTQLYQVNLSHLPQGPGLYNLVWHTPMAEDQTTRLPSHGAHCYTEPEDAVQQNYLERVEGGHRVDAKYQHNCEPRALEEDQVYGLYAPGAAYLNTDERPQESRHPLYIGQQAQLNPGQLSDVHLSSRQQLYTQAAPQVIPGADTSTSPGLGQQAHNTAHSLSRLLGRFGSDPDVDLLLLCGDLHDHVVNADPAHPQHQAIDTPKKLWDALDRQHHPDRERYPRYIDALKALSLIHDFMNTYQKPVCFIDGNHEGYEVPYGISPRFGPGEARANAGIPADHGLTLYEATLLYGPDYGNPGLNQGHFNFDPGNLAWVHQLVTPWRDWAIAYGEAQTFIGLGWGEEEDFIHTTLTRGGSLPRATQSCTDAQLALVEDAIDGRGAAQNLLLTHFTHINYATDIALSSSTGRVDPTAPGIADTVSGGRSRWDQGSFHHNRDRIYRTYLQSGRIHYALSGHSHRAGAYRLKDEANWSGKLPAEARYPHQHNHSGSGACVLVSGAGGPFSWQNREGEYNGQGMEAPQGLKLNVSTGEVQIVHDNESRPRMAVVLDYLWYEGRQPALRYPLTGNASGFSLRLSDDWINASMHGAALLSEIRLHLHTGGKDGYQGFIPLIQTGYTTVTAPSRGPQSTTRTKRYHVEVAYAAGEGGLSLAELKLKNRQGGDGFLYFLSIHLKQIETGPLHDHYDYDSPWCFPVEVEIGEGDRWSIQRVSGLKGGEVPDFKGDQFSPGQLGTSYGIEE